MKSFTMLVCCVALLVATSGCTQPSVPDTREADVKAIQETEVEWAKLSASKDLERYISNYTDDASVLAPNAPVATGKDAIRAAFKPLFADPNFALTFQSTKVEAARSGDLAYSQGTYSMTASDPKGKPANDQGKYLTVWKKQADGKWKAVADMFNSDLPVPAPKKK